MAAAGPVTAIEVPPNIAAKIPPITAEIRPTPGSTPEAIAIAKDNGIAIHATVNPAKISSCKYFLRNIGASSPFK